MRTVIFLAALLPACGALADEAPLYDHENCNLVIRSPTEFHACYARNLERANKVLDAAYAALRAQKVFYVGSREALRDVERAWITYKDKECAYEFGAASSDENYWLAHADCEIRVTEQRIRELRGRPSCTGGDSVCYPHTR